MPVVNKRLEKPAFLTKEDEEDVQKAPSHAFIARDGLRITRLGCL